MLDIIEHKQGERSLDRLTIESCGKSRIPLNGLVQDLHRANAYALYEALVAEMEDS